MRNTPVDIDKFESEGEEPSGVRSSDVQDAVIEFLHEGSDSAFSTAEISESTGQKKQTVNHVVRRLLKNGQIERKRVDGTIYNRWIGGEPSEDMEEA